MAKKSGFQKQANVCGRIARETATAGSTTQEGRRGFRFEAERFGLLVAVLGVIAVVFRFGEKFRECMGDKCEAGQWPSLSGKWIGDILNTVWERIDSVQIAVISLADRYLGCFDIANTCFSGGFCLKPSLSRLSTFVEQVGLKPRKYSIQMGDRACPGSLVGRICWLKTRRARRRAASPRDLRVESGELRFLLAILGRVINGSKANRICWLKTRRARRPPPFVGRESFGRGVCLM